MDNEKLEINQLEDQQVESEMASSEESKRLFIKQEKTDKPSSRKNTKSGTARGKIRLWLQENKQ